MSREPEGQVAAVGGGSDFASPLDDVRLIDPDHYARHGYPHDEWSRLRREAPVYWFDRSEGECDFVARISAPLPIAVIGWLLGLPEPDWPRLFHWTNRILGAHDPEYRDRGSASETVRAAQEELFAYFGDLIAARRRDPRDDLVSLFAHAEVEGRRLSDWEAVVWCNLIVNAGNETTRNATTGGMLVLIDYALRFLLPRIDEIELAAALARLRSNLIGGIKHLPVRYRLKPAAQ